MNADVRHRELDRAACRPASIILFIGGFAMFMGFMFIRRIVDIEV